MPQPSSLTAASTGQHRPNRLRTGSSREALAGALRAVRHEFVLVAGFSFFINLLLLTAPLYMLQVFDRVLASHSVETLLVLTLVAALALVVYGALEAVRGRLLARLAGWFDGALAPELLRASAALARAGRDQGVRGLRELGELRAFLGGNGITAMFDAPWLPLFVAVIWLLHPWLGTLALGGAVVLFALALANELAARGSVRAAMASGALDQDRAEAAVRNADVARAMGMGAALMARWRAGRRTTLAAQGRAQERIATFAAASRALRLFLQVAILGLGAYLVLRAELTAGGMIAASILLSRALAPVEQSIGAWKQFVAARSGLEAVRVLLAAAPAEPRSTSLPTPVGRLGIEGVVWVPPGAERPAVAGVSFKLEPGELCGLIGPSASGKSSLCRLVVGACQPNRGVVRLDGADVAAWTPDELGRHVGYLPQAVDLFPGTVAENIARMDGGVEDAAVVEAARLAGAHEMILRLPQGYETDVGRFGAHLSAGQRQRIGLARALFGSPALLVLDEPNANLDQEGEAALLEALTTIKGRRAAILLVTHRAHVLRDADRVAVLRDGGLQAFGPPDAVLAPFRQPRPVPASAGGASVQQVPHIHVSPPAKRATI